MLRTKKINPLAHQKKPSSKGFLSILKENKKEIIEVNEFLTIGRSLESHVIIDDEFVSQRHVRIERKNGGFFIRDLQSANGTTINGTQIFEALLRDQDQIKIGNTQLHFEFERNGETTSVCSQSANPYWKHQLSKLPSIAETDLPVLILGESGTGKEILAQQIHKESKRSYGPLICVNCSALGESLIESELFGHTKGSFTGATHDRKGAFESARGGTLFLDEIGDLPIHLQPKLLRALENSEIRPVGSDRTIKTNVRIIAATHQDLKTRVVEKKFRSDLFFRLNVIKMTPPSLRERMEDFESLLYYFCKKQRVRMSFAAINKLKQHSWPGNIRELKNCVSRAHALFRNEQIEPQDVEKIIDFIPKNSSVNRLSPAPTTFKEIEKKLILDCLVKNQGNQRKTALDLGIPKSTLHDRVKSYGINLSSLKN